jgi:steroid 5-alpha reductase family enzyme
MCSIGFYKFVYFLSVGYGFAVTGAGIAILLLHGKTLSIWTILMCVLFVIYGIRLGGFLLIREIKSASYRKTLDHATKTEKPMPIFVKATIWVCVSVMYVLQVSPVFYRAANGDTANIFAIIGTIIMAIAILIESLADKQKSAAKKLNPNRFCDTGLYTIVRCPNYLGEVLFWTGVLISGIGAVKGLQWIIAILGYILIVYVMLSGAKRLELRQNKNYGDNPEYQAYVKKTPIIFPLIPLYHLENVKWIVV